MTVDGRSFSDAGTLRSHPALGTFSEVRSGPVTD